MPTPSPRRGRSAGPGRFTLSEIAALAGISVKTLRRRILPPLDDACRRQWVAALDLRHRDAGALGLIHGDAALVHQHLAAIAGLDRPLD